MNINNFIPFLFANDTLFGATFTGRSLTAEVLFDRPLADRADKDTELFFIYDYLLARR
jgi:hypothetical protein